MRTLILLTVLVMTLGAQSPPPATDLTNDQIQAFLKALPRDRVSDLPIRVVDVGGYKVGVYGVFRPKDAPQDANMHPTKITEVYQILEGSATLVTGGKLINPRPAPAPSTSLRGDGIEGGVSRHIAKGDVIIIPGYLPHWFSKMDSDLVYLITRPDPEGKTKLK